jgi:predicted amidophosphoribosyltransferase
VCPSCAAAHAPAERFCRDCGLPLVLAAGAEDSGGRLSEARERARKVLPQYSEGPLTRVATARHQAEAEMLEGMLLEQGIPSLLRRSGGFDVPDFLASGPRDILVPASGAELAREVLGTSEAVAPRAAGTGTPAWVQAMAVALAVLILAVIAAGVFAAVF